MGKRITLPYTRNGDKGTTNTSAVRVVYKDSAQVRAIGAIDELNCKLGTLRYHNKYRGVDGILEHIQHRLFDFGADLSYLKGERITEDDVKDLEYYIELLEGNSPNLTEFVLPGGSILSCLSHEARTICRRAECEITTINFENWTWNIAYINRLSSFLFSLALMYNKADDIEEMHWIPRERPQSK